MCQKKIMRKRSSEHLSNEPPKKRMSPGGNILPSQITPGEIFTDLQGKQWRLGKAIGSGGFGEIYLASSNTKEPVKNDAKYIVKVESHTNGPLFVEINCLIRIAKLDMIEEWKKCHQRTELGVPHYVASGSHLLNNNEKLRFLVIPKYDQDLEKIFLSKNKKFNLKTVILICIQILNALKYIHSKGYVHCDVKASNILYYNPKSQNTKKIEKKIDKYGVKQPVRACRFNKVTSRMSKNLRQVERVNYIEDDIYFYNYDFDYGDLENELIHESPEMIEPLQHFENDAVILIDYGLAAKYLTSDGLHKQFCKDERKAHAGTILFCSIDAHLGASSRRSDLESLGYNLVYWLTSSLPWEDDVSNPETVQRKKEHYLNNIDGFLKTCFGGECPTFIYKYFNYVNSLTFEAEPDYDYCQKLFQSAIKEFGYKTDNKFDFDNLEGWGQKPKKSKKNIENEMIQKKTKKTVRKPLTSNIIIEKPKLRKDTIRKNLRKKLRWSKIPNLEEILRKSKNLEGRKRKLTESSDSSTTGNSLQTLNIKSLNPTYAMLEVFNKCNGIIKSTKSNGIELEQREGYTPVMNFFLTKMNQRRLEEIQQETENIVPIRKTKTRNRQVNNTVQKSNLKKTIKSHTSHLSKEVVKRKMRSARILRGYGLRG